MEQCLDEGFESYAIGYLTASPGIRFITVYEMLEVSLIPYMLVHIIITRIGVESASMAPSIRPPYSQVDAVRKHVEG